MVHRNEPEGSFWRFGERIVNGLHHIDAAVQRVHFIRPITNQERARWSESRRKGAKMTNFAKTLTLAAAALLLATGAASAQSLRADIPFAFHLGNTVLPAGTYDIADISHGAQPVLTLRNEHGPSALALPTSPQDPAKEWQADGRPRLAFECGETCTLVRVWEGGGHPAYELHRPKRSDMGIRIAVIVMRTDKAD
jgi:hypothetical protein